MPAKKTETPVTQAQVRKLFKEVEELREQMENFRSALRNMLDDLGTMKQTRHVAPDLKSCTCALEEVRTGRALCPTHGWYPAKQACCKCHVPSCCDCGCHKPSTIMRDGHYGHLNVPQNDAEWQRVIDEKWLCVLATTHGGPQWIGTIRAIKPFKTAPDGVRVDECQLLNRPGVMQPYFGRGMPVKPETRVLVRFRDGSHSTTLARQIGWDIGGASRGDIVAFMVLQ